MDSETYPPVLPEGSFNRECYLIFARGSKLRFVLNCRGKIKKRRGL
jgi:hypothetical protein